MKPGVQPPPPQSIHPNDLQEKRNAFNPKLVPEPDMNPDVRKHFHAQKVAFILGANQRNNFDIEEKKLVELHQQKTLPAKNLAPPPKRIPTPMIPTNPPMHSHPGMNPTMFPGIV